MLKFGVDKGVDDAEILGSITGSTMRMFGVDDAEVLGSTTGSTMPKFWGDGGEGDDAEIWGLVKLYFWATVDVQHLTFAPLPLFKTSLHQETEWTSHSDSLLLAKNK